MARRGTQVAFIARVAVPIVLGLVFLGYILDALFPVNDPNAQGVYNGLIIVSLILSVAFAGELAAALYGRRPIWRTWAILLGATVAIWILGVVLHNYLPRPELAYLGAPACRTLPPHRFRAATRRSIERS